MESFPDTYCDLALVGIHSSASKLRWQDPTKEEPIVRPSSSERKAEKPSAKGAQKPTGEIKDILELVMEFKEIVTQMAFEKFDFHQWFRYVSINQNEGGFPVAKRSGYSSLSCCSISSNLDPFSLYSIKLCQFFLANLHDAPVVNFDSKALMNACTQSRLPL